MKNCPIDIGGDDPEEIFLSSPRIKRRIALEKKAEEFLALYRQDLTYEDIGKIYNLTRERVRQILKITPNFEFYLKDYEQEKIERLKEKKRAREIKSFEKSLGVRFRERVAELWDLEKNGDLDPTKIRPNSNVEIWLKCPKNGHSWVKMAHGIVNSWENLGTSGCPVCIGRFVKVQKQRPVAEVYPLMVEKYWNYEKKR